MDFIFNIVAQTLFWLAAVTGFSYMEMNIIAYYIILPFIYILLIDCILQKHILKILYVITWTVGLCFIKDFNAFSNALFQASVDFLLLFACVGLDYVAASVVVCVILPSIAFAVLFWQAFPRKVKTIKKRLF